VSLLFGPTRTARRGFLDAQVETLKRGAPLCLFDDEWRTPLALRAAAECLIAIARSDVEGTLHLGGPERMSRYEMGLRLARAIGCSEEHIVRASRTSLAGGEPRPRDVALDSRKFIGLFPNLEMGLFESECLRMGT
jgi:dTDP-4-dehydrorhamnose reductase